MYCNSHKQIQGFISSPGPDGSSLWVYSQEDCTQSRAGYCSRLLCPHGLQCEFNAKWTLFFLNTGTFGALSNIRCFRQRKITWVAMNIHFSCLLAATMVSRGRKSKKIYIFLLLPPGAHKHKITVRSLMEHLTISINAIFLYFQSYPFLITRQER